MSLCVRVTRVVVGRGERPRIGWDGAVSTAGAHVGAHRAASPRPLTLVHHPNHCHTHSEFELELVSSPADPVDVWTRCVLVFVSPFFIGHAKN